MIAPVGRKRSDASRRAILESVVELLREHGYGRVSVDLIAKTAGVGKQTMYRWWKSKPDVVLEALEEYAADFVAVSGLGDLATELNAFLTATFKTLNGPKSLSAVLRGLMAHAQLDNDFLARFRRFTATRRTALRHVLQRAASNGEIERGDLDVLVDMLFGFMWYRLLLGHAPLDSRSASHLARLASQSVRSNSSARSKQSRKADIA